ncbi:hypothetical protein FSP39_018831 [Pinctada imbricata]|uniref:Huntingtin n=1 Tax=Pinctada imbricata TaxID=66713 RepID=A0AA88Y0U1_PINIB|nr:hypothetical protein FSP39_018831 [Pinctada imbricata]
MATIEKLIKAFEALKVFHPPGISAEETVKKKEQPVSKKDKMANCNIVADSICAHNMRAIGDFPKFLGIAMETFLMLCDDAESDVRMVADECLNRSIKILLETNLGRLQVELYKEIKKNGSSRTLRAALWRFAEMAHLIRPQKCRPYIVNLLPCLARICKREEEAIQETLSQAMQKICPPLMGFANESEVKALLKAFVPNLKSSSASCRRTAASSLVLICQHSRSPSSFYNYLLNVLLEMLIPVEKNTDLHSLIGVILCLRSLIPYLNGSSKDRQGLKGSFGVMTKDKEQSVSADQLCKVIQILVHFLGHQDHNVVTGTLEALQQLLKNPSDSLLNILLTENSIRKSFIYEADQQDVDGSQGLPEVPSFSRLSEDTGLEEDIDASEPLVNQSEATIEDESVEISSDYQSVTSEKSEETQGETEPKEEAEVYIDTQSGDAHIHVTTSDTEYSGIEIGDLMEERSERSNLSQVESGSQDTLLSTQSLSPSRQPNRNVNEDLNGNLQEDLEAMPTEEVQGTFTSQGTDIQDEIKSIGSLYDPDCIPIDCLVRVLCRRFLLNGKPGELINNRSVRISMRTLALGCLSSAVMMKPQILFLPLQKEMKGDVQLVKDVLQYACHMDPLLKGNTTILIGNLINTVLRKEKGDFTKWLQKYLTGGDDLHINHLMDIVTTITEDESSVAVRLALTAMQTCLNTLLQSLHSPLGLQSLMKLLCVHSNPYWLVKVELLEIFGSINYKLVQHLEHCCIETQRGDHHFLGKLNIQQRILDIIYLFLENDDLRVRHCAAQTLVRMAPNVLFSCDNQQFDPIVAEARDMSYNLLSTTLREGVLDPPPMILGMVEPYNSTMMTNALGVTESNLSRMVMALLQLLNLSTSKHLSYGCCHALCLLSEAYPATLYAHAWGCGPPTTLIPKDPAAGGKSTSKRPPSRSLSSSSLEELSAGSGGGPLTILLCLLTSTSVSLDLLAHNDALQFAGNLVAGSAYRSLKTADIPTSNNEGEEAKWTAVQDRILVPLIEQLLTHIVRVLNCFTHVIDDQTPGPPQVKPSLPSLPNTPSLSPIKRKAKGDKEGSGSGTMGSTPDKGSKQQKEKDKESEKEKSKKDTLGMFYNSPHYMKLFDVIKGAFSNYKVSLDLTNQDKFCTLLRTSLKALSQLLEISTLGDIGKYADEILVYLKATVSMEPTITILCVQQLLKSLFGTNLASQWSPQQNTAPSRKPGKATRMTANTEKGLYYQCFTQPYSQFTQSLATAAFKATSPSETEETAIMLNSLRKSVDRKIPAILKPGCKTDKAAIAAYIRLFEPLVIKALKQYTVTSCLELQRQVLDLLSQLIQLRVNYCLLDSDQVFIGFVIKQFEYIEEGQIRNSEDLVPHVFNFLVMLSYEKYHSKSIVSMPKIIQLCDGIMASGLQPNTHAIPALRPIVYDLFLIRGGAKVDINRDLETQREVVVSMLLRLVQYYQTLDILVIVLQQCRKESEEKWKRLSRQIIDAVLPALAKLQINLDNMEALDVLHRLFEAVAPLVFRPVDVLLKTLLQTKLDLNTTENLQRWMCLVLSILRVLMAQSKEEVLLSRCSDLGLGLSLFKIDSSNITEEHRNLTSSFSPEQMLARFLLQVVGKCSSVINNENRTVLDGRNKGFLIQQLSHLLLYITHMFQSGLFRKVATSTMQISSEKTTPDCFYGIQDLNESFLSVPMTTPILTLQWCNILILLNYDDQAVWSEVMQTTHREPKPGTNQSTNLICPPVTLTHCCNLEILRRGGLVLFSDYVCENLLDAEQMTWLVINHVNDLIFLSRESPVQDIISAIHRNPAASSLFIQAIHARCNNVSKPSVVKKTLKCLDAIHLSQTGALITLLIDKFLNTHHLSVARMCDSIVCRRVEMLLADNYEDAKKQLPQDDLDKLLNFMESNHLTKRHARLVSLLRKLRANMSQSDGEINSMAESHPILYTENQKDNPILNKDLYVAVVKHQCYSTETSLRECSQLLQELTYADILSITMTKEFSLDILPECVSQGAHQSVIKSENSPDILDNEGNKVPQEPEIGPLFKAAELTLVRHINNLVNHLPVPHQVLSFPEVSDVKLSRYQEKMEDIFTDTTWKDMVFSLTNSLNAYLLALSSFPWQPVIPKEAHSDICRFCVLCTEMVDWLLHHNQLPTAEQLHSCLQCLSLVLQSQQLSSLIGQRDHVTWVCSLTATVHQIFFSMVVAPGEKLVNSMVSQESCEEPQSQNDLSVIVKACDQISELVQYILTNKRSHSLPEFIPNLLINIIIGLARQPVLNSYARTPSLVWKLGWAPTPSGETKTHLPPLPVDFLKDKDVLREYVCRINVLGWINRQQFEETWMSLLAMLNPVLEDVSEQVTSPEEEIERAQCMVIAVKAITSMLLQSTLTPVPGNPSNSTFEIRPRDKPLGFLHTRCGKKLTAIRSIIEQEIQSLFQKSRTTILYSSAVKDESDMLRYMFDSNLEREVGNISYNLGQISIEGLWSVVGALNSHLAESTDTNGSVDSQEDLSPNKASVQQQFALISFDKRERTISSSGLDIHSCLQFLLELYSQWMTPNSILKPPLMLRNEVVKSIVSLSDLFVEKDQYEWMLDILMEMHKSHPGEDELIMQYLDVGICKAASVVGLDSSTGEKVMKLIDSGLRTPHLPSRIAVLHGILYLLESAIPDVNKFLIPMATDFLFRNISTTSQICITSQQYVMTMWATAFYIMENYSPDMKDWDFSSKILQMAVSTASGNEESVSTPVYLAIMKGLERLLLADVLSSQDAESIMKLSVDRLCLPSPQRSLAALGLMFTCMYSGKQRDQFSPRPRQSTENVYNFDMVLQDPESLILAMERVTVLFDRIKKGYPYEARVITRVLPTFLADFFPPQDIMNKIIGEFISSQQPYPQLIALVVFQVFSNLHSQEQQSLVQDWVMLSLSNFTQRTPFAMAVWSLTCFFISASTNQWLRALIHHVVGRMGKTEDIDDKLFSLAAMDFYTNLKDEGQQRSFISTFQSVVHLGPTFQQLLDIIKEQR